MSYSSKLIEFVSGGLEKRYKCIECHNVLEDPVQSNCGHRFCWSCLDDILNQKPPGEAKCPDDGEVLKREEVFRDKCAQKEILGLECYCPNKSLGCLWTGLLAHLQDHDAECSYTKVKCLYSNLGCGVVILRHQLAKHAENDCVYKVMECPFCHVGYPGVKMREHLEECRKFPVKCPHGCGESEILRENIPEHSISCPRAPTQCRFKSMGCDFEGPRGSLDKHLSSSSALNSRENTAASLNMVDIIRRLDFQDERLAVLREDVRRLNQAPARPRYAASASSGGSDHRFDRVEHSLALHEIQFHSVGFVHRDSLDEHLRSSTTEHEILSASQDIVKLRDEMRYLQLQLNALQTMNQTYNASLKNHERQLSVQNESLVLNKQALCTHQYKLEKVKESVEILQQSVEQLSQALNQALRSAGLNMADIIGRSDFQGERLAVSAEDMRRLNQAPLHPHYLASASAGGSNHQFDRVEHSLALHEIQLADLQEIRKTISYDGISSWKIFEFQRRFREAVDGKTLSIYSTPFYTARYGYKICAGASLNGDGMALFFIVMRGEHDGSLEWPFQETITIKLLDEEKTCQALQTFRPDPNSSSVQRPVSCMNIAFGCPMFCPIRLLRSRCVHDDSILIEITVSTSRSGMPTIQKA